MYKFNKKLKYPHVFSYSFPNKANLETFIDNLKQNFQPRSFKTKRIFFNVASFMFGKKEDSEFKQTFIKEYSWDKSNTPIKNFFVYFKNDSDASNFKLLFCENMDELDIKHILMPVITFSVNFFIEQEKKYLDS